MYVSRLFLQLHRNRAILTDQQLEVHTISSWKEGKSRLHGEAVGPAQMMFGRPLIRVSALAHLKHSGDVGFLQCMRET